MAITVIFKEEKAEVIRNYPKLMINDRGVVILAERCINKKIVGTIIDALNERVGQRGDYWPEEDFKDYNQEVVLKNA